MNADALTLAVHFRANQVNRAVRLGVRHRIAAEKATTVGVARPIQRVVNVRGVIPWPKRRK